MENFHIKTANLCLPIVDNITNMYIYKNVHLLSPFNDLDFSIDYYKCIQKLREMFRSFSVHTLSYRHNLPFMFVENSFRSKFRDFHLNWNLITNDSVLAKRVEIHSLCVYHKYVTELPSDSFFQPRNKSKMCTSNNAYKIYLFLYSLGTEKTITELEI